MTRDTPQGLSATGASKPYTAGDGIHSNSIRLADTYRLYGMKKGEPRRRLVQAFCGKRSLALAFNSELFGLNFKVLPTSSALQPAGLK
jgi:hypothetical protein